jgi:hypothetical protein
MELTMSIPAQVISTPLPSASILADKIAELQAALQTAAPSYESLLHTIHVALNKDESLAHLLTEEQVGIICAGLTKKQGIVIAETTAKAKTTSGKSLKNISLDDLGM